MNLRTWEVIIAPMPDSAVKIISAISIGHHAREQISSRKPAEVIGVISAGVYLVTEQRRVVFITPHPFHGPISLTLPSGTDLNHDLVNGMKVICEDSRLFIPQAGLAIDLTKSRRWKPYPPRGKTNTVQERAERLRSLALKVFQAKPNAGYSQLLPFLTGQPGSKLTTPEEVMLFETLRAVRQTLRGGDAAGAALLLVPWLGRGRGLTPSGDDLATGLLLTANRWGRILFPDLDLTALNITLVNPAFNRTTSLAATFLECAAQGSADEAMLAALDWFFGGSGGGNEHAAYFINRGGSSGADTLAGIATAALFDTYPTNSMK